MKRTWLIFGLGFCLVFSAGCQAPVSATPWQYADLRLLDPVDAPQGSQDLVAAYTRLGKNDVQLRLDWLDHGWLPDYDLFVCLDTRPGGASALPGSPEFALGCEATLVIPATGALQVRDGNGAPLADAALRVIREAFFDQVEISFSPAVVHGPGRANASRLPFQIQVILTQPGSLEIYDTLGPFNSDDPPPAPAPAWMAFWNTYPAYTPALALRRWDGAHTGPFGGRHGLDNLLRVAASQGVPLTLLDLKDPDSLSALDYAGKLADLQAQVIHRQVALPDPLPDSRLGPFSFPVETGQSWLERQRTIALDFGFGPSQAVYASSIHFAFPPDVQLVILPASPAGPTTLTTALTRWQALRLLPLPAGLVTLDQASREGPSAELRPLLVQAALQSADQPAEILVLGGDLPLSAWGDPQSARLTLRYLKNRPWIRVLSLDDLLSAPLASAPSAPSPALAEPPPVEGQALLAALQQAPGNPITEAAWQVYDALPAPLSPARAELSSARQAYLGQVWSLLQAAQWAAHPVEMADCSQDPDQDGQPECLLTSAEAWLLFEIPEGSLTLAISRLENQAGVFQVHQWLGPATQFASGLSRSPGSMDNPLLAAGPGNFPGAFGEPGADFQALVAPGALQFSSADGSIRKVFQITANGLRLEYSQKSGRMSPLFRLPLALDPWQRFSAGWWQSYHFQSLQSTPPFQTTLSWQSVPGWRVRLQATTGVHLSSFLDSQPLLAFTENPNQDFSPAHYLPFPLALVELTPANSFTLEIIIETINP